VEYTPQTVNDREKYATYTRDSVTGLDYAMNRYYSSQWGRFLSPDPYGRSISLGNPQSWNRYGYTGGDPANGTDPSGLIDGPPGAPGGPGSGFGWGGGDGAGFGFGGYGCPPDLPSAGNWYDAGGDSPPSVGPSLFETGCGQASGGPSAGADLGPGVLAEALSDAEKALHQKDCAGVFNTKPNLSQTYDPADVLDGIVDGIKMGDEYFGSMWAEKLNPTFAAETQYGSGQWVGGTYQYTSANIILQDNGPGSYLDQGAASLALTLIHELGHVFNIVARLGGSAIQNDANPDGTANAAAEAANALALAPCAKALGLN
jgi:RHS repeat-associated protein